MIPIEELIEKASGLAKIKYGEGTGSMFDPIFRKENDKYYIGFAISKFNDPENNDYKLKRPMNWMLVDILTGELVDFFDSNEKDYTTKEKLPFDMMITGEGNSVIYDYCNFVTSKYFSFKKNVITELKIKKGKDSDINLHNMPVLKIDDKFLSPRDYVIDNVDAVLEQAKDLIREKISNVVEQGYKDNYNYLIEEIRRTYEQTNEIDIDLNSRYIELLKYLWPDYIEIINNFDNTSENNNEELDKSIRDAIERKELERVAKQLDKEKMDNLIDKIDQRIAELDAQEKSGEAVQKTGKDVSVIDDLKNYLDEAEIEHS